MNLKSLLSFLIFLVFLYILFSFIPLNELLKSVSTIDIKTFFFSFLFYSLSQISRTFRWKILMREIPFGKLFLLNSANILLNNILPARSGELSWFYYSRKLGINLKISLWSFLIGRLYDFFSLIVIFLISYSLVFVNFLTFFILLLCFFVAYTLPFTVRIIPSVGKLTDLKEFLRKEFTSSLSLKLFLISFLGIVTKAYALFILTRNILDINPFIFITAFTGGELTSVLPFHGFMGFGTYEAGFLLPLNMMGIELRDALKAGFIAHSFLLLSSAVFGGISILLLHIPFRKFP